MTRSHDTVPAPVGVTGDRGHGGTHEETAVPPPAASHRLVRHQRPSRTRLGGHDRGDPTPPPDAAASQPLTAVDAAELRLALTDAVAAAHLPAHASQLPRLLAASGSASLEASRVVAAFCDRAVPRDAAPASVRDLARCLHHDARHDARHVAATLAALAHDVVREGILHRTRRDLWAYVLVLGMADRNGDLHVPTVDVRDVDAVLDGEGSRLGAAWSQIVAGLVDSWPASPAELASAAAKLAAG